MAPAAAARFLPAFVLLGLLLAAFPAQAQEPPAEAPREPASVEVRWADTPESLDAQAGRVPVTLVLRVDATGCEGGTEVPVVVGAEGTDQLQAALDRARHVFQVPPGAVHEARTTLQLALGGAGAGVVTLHARTEAAPGSCLGQAGAAAAHVVRVGAWSPQESSDGGTRPIALRAGEPVPRVLLVVAAALLAVLALRAWPSRGS